MGRLRRRSERLTAGPRGVLHPPGPSLGLDGIAAAKLVLAPALAVDTAGRRLGQGGGSYDRALTRTSAPVLAVVFDDELIASVPVEPHDRPVNGVLTPSGGVRYRLRPTRGGRARAASRA